MARELALAVHWEPRFPTPVFGSISRRPDLVFRDWDNGRDLYVDVVGSSPPAGSYRSAFMSGGAAVRAAP